MKVADLTPLGELTSLTNLNLDGCGQVRDVQPLAALVRLKTLDLRRCRSVAPDDVAWLQSRLTECKILTTP